MPILNGYEVTEIELALLRELAARKTKFLVVGQVSAVIQGSDVGTRDIDLWFKSTSDLSDAAKTVGGTFVWRGDPPCLVGKGLERIDVVNRMDGLDRFDVEYAGAVECQIDNFVVLLLPLDRIITSKEAAGRPKDLAALPSLYATLVASKRRGR